ncbi:MAG: DUF5652 family protein [Parcubacteria group bacterium]|jgi:hypothetical protein
MNKSQLISFLSTHGWIIALAAVWTISWKGVALWRAARRSNLVWFIILLVVNTLAILEIIYIFAISRKKTVETAPQEITSESTQKKIV